MKAYQRAETRDQILEGRREPSPVEGWPGSTWSRSARPRESRGAPSTATSRTATSSSPTSERARGGGSRSASTPPSAAAPAGASRIEVVLHHAANDLREHEILRALLQNEPAFVLSKLREAFTSIPPAIRPMVEEEVACHPAVRSGTMTVEQYVEWLTRLLIAIYLFPTRTPTG